MRLFFGLMFAFLINAKLLFALPYVVLVSFDGFRWDYLDRGLSPNLTNFASNGVRAISLQPSFPSGTFPNHYSIVTGLYPENHNIIGNHIINRYSGNVFTLRDTNAVTDPWWYLGEAIWETARRQGLKTASFFWPGSELKLEWRHPDIFMKYDSKIPYRTRVDSVVSWLSLPFEKRPRFVTIYFEETDNRGHAFGPNSPQVDTAIMVCDQVFGYLLQKLSQLPIKDSIDIIVVSDHGMTDVKSDRIINISSLLNVKDVTINSAGYLAFVNGNPDSVEKAYKILERSEKNFKVYKRSEVPAYFHFSNNPFIGDLVVIPEFGWTLSTSNEDYVHKVKGNHGYDIYWMDMHGIFLAGGPSFKKGYRVGTIQNVDIYPLICKILNIVPRGNIDGRLERIEYILK